MTSAERAVEPRGPPARAGAAGPRRLIDQRRREQSRRRRESLALLQEAPPREVSDEDDTLVLLFMCCHPELTPASAVALTLRAVGGLTTAMHVLYLIFNEGYASSTGDELHRVELSDEAIRLTTMVHRLLPDEGEVAGLLALMLLIDARRPARTTAAGELVPLAEQDRTLWDRALIAEGTALIDDAVGMGPVSEYQLQAAIAAVHDRARQADDTDWPQILALYGLLEQLTGNPVVTLNKAVAAAMADGPSAGLAVLDGVAERLNGHYRLDAVRAHLLEMAGDTNAALAHYRAAAGRTTNLTERRYLAMRAARLTVS